MSVRRLEANDSEAARRLGAEAFGEPSSPPTIPATIDEPGMVWYGAFEDDLLVARMVDREYEAYFGGVPVPTCGVAGVTVAAEYRRPRHSHATLCRLAPQREAAWRVDLQSLSLGASDLSQVRLRDDR